MTLQALVNPFTRKKTKIDLVSISLFRKAKRDYTSKVKGKRITITDFNQESIL